MVRIIPCRVGETIDITQVQRRVGPGALENLCQRHGPKILAISSTQDGLIGQAESRATSRAEIVVVRDVQIGGEPSVLGRPPSHRPRPIGRQHAGGTPRPGFHATVFGSNTLKPVGSYPTGVSWVGAHDLAGNAMEWVQDWLDDYAAESVENPTGPAQGRVKVEKGGWWGSTFFVARSAYRHFEDPPDYSDKHIGFRLVSP